MLSGSIGGRASSNTVPLEEGTAPAFTFGDVKM